MVRAISAISRLLTANDWKVKYYSDIQWEYIFAATEIQNIQIGEGNACTNLAIPIYMIFPRLFTCPTLSTSNFKVGKNTIAC